MNDSSLEWSENMRRKITIEDEFGDKISFGYNGDLIWIDMVTDEPDEMVCMNTEQAIKLRNFLNQFIEVNDGKQ